MAEAKQDKEVDAHKSAENIFSSFMREQFPKEKPKTKAEIAKEQEEFIAECKRLHEHEKKIEPIIVDNLQIEFDMTDATTKIFSHGSITGNKFKIELKDKQLGEIREIVNGIKNAIKHGCLVYDDTQYLGC